MTTESPQLRLKNVDKYYGPIKGGVYAVQSISMDVPKGEIIALLGSSGCGKTSTLRMVAGFEAVSAGSIELAGKPVHMLAPVKRNVAMAFEGYSLYPTVSVRDNIAFALKASRLADEMPVERQQAGRRRARGRDGRDDRGCRYLTLAESGGKGRC